MGRNYTGHYLNEEQKKLVSENMSLLYWYLYKKIVNKGIIRNHEIDECEGYLIWNLCLAAESYNPEKEVAFSTWAVISMRSGLLRYLELKKRYGEREVLTDFSSRDDDDDSYYNDYEYVSKTKKSIGWGNVKELFDMVEMTPMEEQVIFFYYRKKYTYERIAELVGMSKESVRQRHNSVVRKIQEVVKEKDFVMKDFM